VPYGLLNEVLLQIFVSLLSLWAAFIIECRLYSP
jgi:hypothetical protein